MMSDPELAMRMVSMFRDGAPEDSPPPSGAPHEGDSPARTRTSWCAPVGH